MNTITRNQDVLGLFVKAEFLIKAYLTSALSSSGFQTKLRIPDIYAAAKTSRFRRHSYNSLESKHQRADVFVLTDLVTSHPAQCRIILFFSDIHHVPMKLLFHKESTKLFYISNYFISKKHIQKSLNLDKKKQYLIYILWGYFTRKQQNKQNLQL